MSRQPTQLSSANDNQRHTTTPRVLALILAGGRGSRLSPLTDRRAKPAVPVLGHYRLIDFALSNLAHSGISDVWVLEQYQPHRLNTHLSGGRPWDLDRTRGGLVVMPPFTAPHQGGFSQGNAHALELHAQLIAEFAPDVLLVLSADHLYTLNIQEVIAEHLTQQAEVTMVTTEVPRTDATRYANVNVNTKGRVTQLDYKPKAPLGTGNTTTITAEIFAYDPQVLLAVLQELGDRKGGPLGDYGEELLPALVQRGKAHAFSLSQSALSTYWRDVGTLGAYLAAHLDLCEGRGVALDLPGWPVLTTVPPLAPAQIERTARLDRALVCSGAQVAGKVTRSVIGPGAVIEQGARVKDSVILAGAVVRSGASVTRSIIDEGAVVGENAQVGRARKTDDTETAKDIAVIGQQAHLKAGMRVKGGEYLAAGGRTVRQQEDEDVSGA